MNHHQRPYCGRFAPSPTGDLHFGSLVAAVASFLESHKHGGRWQVRIEDIDPPREVPGSAQAILRDLERLGMNPDGEVLYQSNRTAAYEETVDLLLERGDAYWCGCSRADLPHSGIYPGTCRDGLPRGRKRQSVRLRTKGAIADLADRLQGNLHERLDETVGDFVIRRADGLPAYQLAVVVDDAFQGITHIVRGAHLLGSTPRQVLLQEKLALHTPAYIHVPVVLGKAGAKLSKRLDSDPITKYRSTRVLAEALRFLGQAPPPAEDLAELWDWAFAYWDIDSVPRSRELAFETSAP